MNARRNDGETPGADEPPGLLAEYRDFLVNNKKWWLVWVVLVLAGTLALVLFGSKDVPFVYDLF